MNLLTLDDLAARWGVTVERASRRIKHSHLRSINLGTPKNPELRFRLDWVESWESEVCAEACRFLGSKDEENSMTTTPQGEVHRGRYSCLSSDPLAEFA